MKFDIIVHVLIEILIVIGLSRVVGLGFRRLKQPLVIGEIVAGVMLGPSLLGLLAPSLATALFPPETIPFLNVLAQIGLIFFMFLIGLELDPKYLRSHLDIAVLVSHVSILVPFSLGSLLALLLYPLVSSGVVSFTAFALFLGAAMSITAFPVLARIITENNLQNTRLGTMALTCAAVDDVTAWCLLALAIAVTRTNSMAGAIPTIVLSLVYIAFMVTVGRKFLKTFAAYYDRSGRLNQFVLAVIYMGVVLSALVTELIGIHLIFGAFLIGAVMPKHPGLTRELAQKTEDFVLTFLLPVFFAYSGLRTQIGLLNTPFLWLLCGLVVLVAIVGKYCGTYFAARVSGIEKREASALGWLMNTRGLTELIVLNIGLSLNVISPLLFTMLVIMALVTTFMTSPLLEWTYPKRLIRKDVVESTTDEIEPAYRIIVPIANPNSQKGLVELAVTIALGGTDQSLQLAPAAIYPLSLIQLDEEYAFGGTPAEAERLIAERERQLAALIASLEPPLVRPLVRPIVRVATDVAQETARIADSDRADLILMGWHRPAFSRNRLGGRVGQILSTARTDVAVFVDRQHSKLEHLLVPYVSDLHNDLGLEIALRILVNSKNSSLTILSLTQGHQANDRTYEFRTLMEQLPSSVRDRIHTPQIESNNPIAAVVEASAKVDLTIAGASREWGLERQTLGFYADQLAVQCHSSLLITRRYSQVTAHLSSVLNTATGRGLNEPAVITSAISKGETDEESKMIDEG
ncbi:cation:proton antiporter [Leptolyngbya sp. FACHB-321]|uniref:cation:proton antiporter n=1 Tax=Leptolyngbya sp. FACHB-321 TaxID=2692807 RepID=UPI00168492D9|nr:cation:proton antiporter [Leptolyngbya sp. FACHB-321]MBD2036390.1 cation:proton antiporter [Leptolyngbya sp. FACHB-321]